MYVHSVAKSVITRSINVLSFFPREASQHRFVSSSTRWRNAPPIANTACNLSLELLQCSRGTLGAERSGAPSARSAGIDRMIGLSSLLDALSRIA